MDALIINNLVKHFGDTKAVNGISFSVSQGEIFGFLGPNGAGKTTTIRCIMDFIHPTAGSIRILGKDTQRDGADIRHQVGYLSGYVRFYGQWTGHEHIAYAKKLNGEKNISDELIERLAFDPSIKTKNLSSGNRQKLGLILAFMNQPKLLIMDEPTNALDPLLQNTVYELLGEAQKRGATVFMSSHNLAEVDRICTKVCIIKNGKVTAVKEITALENVRVYTAHIHLANTVDLSMFKKIGAEIIESRNDYATMKITGDIGPLIKLLSTLPVKDLRIEHASLEDIFLTFYH